MSHETPALTVVAGVLERPNREVLICLPKSAENARLWEFPTGVKARDESHEQALRRTCQQRLGVSVDIHVGQPPFVADYHGQLATYRFFLATIESGEAVPADFAEVRWVNAAQLCEYDFDKAHKPVVDWYVS